MSQNIATDTEAALPQGAAEKPNADATPAQTSAPGIAGHLELVTAGEVSGWAWNPAAPEVRVGIEVLEGERVVASGDADQFRPDLLAAGIGDGKHCFRIAMPDDLLDGLAHSLRVRASGLQTDLPGSPVKCVLASKPTGAPLKPVAPAIRGHVDHVLGLEVMGWAWHPDTPKHRLQVEVLDGERLVALGEADQFRTDLLAAGIGDGKHCFRIILPAHVADGTTHTIRVRVAGSAADLPGSPVKCVLESALSGEVTGLDGSAIIGSISDSVHGRQEYLVRIREGSLIVGEARTGKQFRVPLGPEVFDGRVHVFTVEVVEPYSVIGQLPVIAPYFLSEERLLQITPAGVHRAYLSPSAGYRYDSLRRQVRRIEGMPGAARAAELEKVMLAHEQVLRGFVKEPQGYSPLEFTVVTSPQVSLVIPVHNKFAVTYHCLASLLLAPCEASFEVIIVDDGSEDETERLADIVKGVRVVRHEAAQGFVKSSNHGATLARGEYVVMLNNDTEVTAGWLDSMLDVFRRYDRVGLVGAKLLYPDGRLQEAGGIVWGNGAPWNYGRNGNPRDPRYNYVRQIDYASGACIMLPKVLWDDLGGFDLEFAPAYYEDTDLAFRVRERGYRTLYTPFAEVIHFEGMTSGTSTASGAKRYQEINKPKFCRRWSTAYGRNGRAGQSPDLEKDRGVVRRALVLDYAIPQPDHDAGSYAAIQEMRLLQALGFKLTFAPQNMGYLGAYTEALQRDGIEVLHAPFYASLQDVIARRGAEYDLVYITRYAVAETCVDVIRRAAPNAKLVLNNADLHFLRELRAALVRGDRNMLDHAVKTREAELAVMRKVDLVLSYNVAEHAVIQSHNLDSTRVALCPWVVEAPRKVAGFKEREGVAFLGGFGHPPNAEAVEFFVEQVMPLLRERARGIKFLVYGSRVPKAIKELASEDVVIKGFVEHVEDVYDTCRIFVAPLLHGAGLKGKVAGALAHGVPCVLSPIAAEGMPLRDGLEARIVKDPAQWAEAIATLYGDQTKWEAMQAMGRAFAEKQFSFEAALATMRESLELGGVFGESGGDALLPASH